MAIKVCLYGRIFKRGEIDERGLLDLFLHATHGVELFGSGGVVQ